MKKVFQKIMAAILIISISASMNPAPISAASTARCYTIKTGKTIVYKNKNLTKEYSVIQGPDELLVRSVTKKSVKITWKDRTGVPKTGYIRTRAVLTKTTGKKYMAKAKVKAYRRPGGRSYGQIISGQEVMKLGTNGKYTQVRYLSSKGDCYAFVKTAEAKKYITGKADPTKPVSSSVSYAPYQGVRYTNQGLSKARIAALDKAKKMVTIRWTAPCDFPTWADGAGTFSEATAEDGSRKGKFVKGKTYTGVPYSMVDHSYDNTAWTAFLKAGITKESMTGRFAANPKAGTAKGIDCSYFVYQALGSAVGFDNIQYQVTSTMQNSRYYKKIKWSKMKPGDVLVSSSHTMLYVGTIGDSYAIFEASSYESKCSYKVYPKSYVTANYGCYKFVGFSD